MRYLSVAEILEELEKDDVPDIQAADVLLLPPGEDVSDEDSGDEDCNDPDRLSRNQLRAPGELQVSRKNNMSESSDDSEDKAPAPPKKKKCRKELDTLHWRKGDLSPKEPNSEPQSVNKSMCKQYSPSASMSKENHPLDFLRIFLSDNVVDLIVKNTVRYAAQKDNPSFTFSRHEILAFFGILYLSGYVPLPRRRMYWENSDDVKIKSVTDAMRLRRFEEILRYLHVCDNEKLTPGDNFAKIRPFADALNESFINNAPPETDISVDESMIPYFGRHYCKQFLRLKPVRFGYKAWVMAHKSGYCLNVDFYQGKDKDRVPGVGLGESIVLKFCEILQSKYPDLQFSFYFDNFFTNMKLICALGNKGMYGTGTVRENRMSKCPIPKKKELAKMKRGEFTSFTESSKGVVAVGWKDNNVVYILSNKSGVAPLQQIQRYSVTKKQKITVPQPNVISHYNKCMGGVDLLDNNIANYRINIRGKKWYMPIIMWLLDVAMVNAWMIARKHGVTLDALSFRRACAQTLLKKYGCLPARPGPMRYSEKVAKTVRESHNDHLIISGQPKRRCAFCKTVKTPLACKKCEVPLHMHCFEGYHNQ